MTNILFLTIATLSLLSIAAAHGRKVQECTNAELYEITINPNIRECAQKSSQLMRKDGCESLEDHDCYCSRLEFMAAVTGCIYLADPSIQVDLLRCSKWYQCASLPAQLNQSKATLTPESSDLIARGQLAPTNAQDGTISTIPITIASLTMLSLFISSLVFW